MRTDKELLDWMQSIMLNNNDYCEIFFAGLRDGTATGQAVEFQIESNPEKFSTVSGKDIREAITKAMQQYEIIIKGN